MRKQELLSEGNRLRDLKRYDEAEKAYRRALELDPKDGRARDMLVFLLRFRRRNDEADEAEKASRKARELGHV